MITAYLIQLACSNAYYNHQDACSAALTSASKQTGVDGTVGSVESYTQSRAKNAVINATGDSVLKAGAFLFAAYKFDHGQNAKFNIPNMGIANQIDTSVSTSGGQLNFHWNF